MGKMFHEGHLLELLTRFVRIFNIILMGKIPHHDDHMAVKSDINEINTSEKVISLIYLA